MHVDLSHPVLLQPDDVHSRIWRYMSLAKFVSLLNNSALFFSRLSAFSDDREGRLPWRNLCEWNSRIALSYERYRDTAAVNSWHMMPRESWVMWQAYCGLTEGIAIRSTYDRLTKCFKSIEGDLSSAQDVWIGCVRYLNDKEMLEDTDGYAPLMCKRDVFAEDQEVRAMVIPDPMLEECFRQTTLPGVNMSVDLDVLIDAVVVAPNASPWFVELVRSLTRHRFRVARSDIAMHPYPTTLRESELVKKVEDKLKEIDSTGVPRNDQTLHRLMYAAFESVHSFENEDALRAHNKERAFVLQYVDWRLGRLGD